MSVLTIFLWLSLWVAVGSVVLAVADGLGTHPTRRVVIGLLLIVASVAGLWRRESVCASLRSRPWLVLPLAIALMTAPAIDELIEGPYQGVTLLPIGLAVVVARPATVWACVALLEVGYGGAVLIARSPETLVHGSALASVLGKVLGYPLAALGLLALAGLFKRFMSGVQPTLDALRQGAPALTPALTRAIEHRGAPLALAAAPVAKPRLTPAEIRVVEGLAAGHAPKELAHQWGRSEATVRSHIKHAKRKTGAETVRELAALAAHIDWPEISHDGP